jgi:signal transduction histidine kinase
VRGQKIDEKFLCQTMGVSRTPVRESLRILNSEGLVDLIPHKGAYVSQPPIEEIRDMFEVMSVLEGMCARLATLKMSEKDLTQKLGIVYSQVRAMSALIDDMFDVAILETGQMKITPEPFPMVELIEDVLQSYELLADQSQLTIQRNFAESLQTVNADPLRIRQVIRNLISNAIKFSLPGGVIKISTIVKPDEMLTIQVEDTGVGIAEEDIENIFKSFYRSKQQLDRAVKGTGLGLHICQQILALHDSRLTVKSRQNVGTTFSFDLKLYKEVVTI